MTSGQKLAIGVLICIWAHSHFFTAYLWWVYVLGKSLNISPLFQGYTSYSANEDESYSTAEEEDERESRIGPNTKWVGNTGYDSNGKIC